MTKDFFASQIERLTRAYPPSSLNEERVLILWEAFKHVENFQFMHAVTHIIGEHTTQALPSLSRFREAVAAHRRGKGSVEMAEVQSAHFCEPCRDFGYGFNGDFVVACMSCENGRHISPAALAKAQQQYDRGAAFMGPGGFKKLFAKLPYDPKQRGEHGL